MSPPRAATAPDLRPPPRRPHPPSPHRDPRTLHRRDKRQSGVRAALVNLHPRTRGGRHHHGAGPARGPHHGGPAPRPRAESQAGWHRHSPAPGALGPSVIVGHVDSDRHGPSVFYGLDALTEGDTVEVVRDDGVTAVFAVEHVVQYFKKELPNQEVYGNLDPPGCG
ncbi:MAG TPA: sortase [Acidimicrobiia bacterium]|nr:sortase [Acidimicrobiia bacterium]